MRIWLHVYTYYMIYNIYIYIYIYMAASDWPRNLPNLVENIAFQILPGPILNRTENQRVFRIIKHPFVLNWVSKGPPPKNIRILIISNRPGRRARQPAEDNLVEIWMGGRTGGRRALLISICLEPGRRARRQTHFILFGETLCFILLRAICIYIYIYINI